MYRFDEQTEDAVSAEDGVALGPAGVGSPDFDSRGFAAEMVALGGRFATAYEVPVEVGVESETGVGLRRSAELDAYRVVEAASATVAGLPGVRSLHIGIAGWRDLLHVVVQAEGAEAEGLSGAASELAAIRERAAAVDGTFDTASVGAATFYAVLPVLAARNEPGRGAIPLAAGTSVVERTIEPRTLERHIAAAAAGVGLDDLATHRMIDRLNQASLTSLLSEATSSPPRRGPRIATLRVAIQDDHVLLITAVGTRVIAFWEPVRRGWPSGSLRAESPRTARSQR